MLELNHKPKETKVALLSGGNSGEREISIASGKGALVALNEAGYDVTCFDPVNKSDLIELVNGEFDVAFLTLHGKGGEDGAIQGFLETIGLPYTGSGVCASAVGMNKAKSKLFYESVGVPTPKSVTIYKENGADVDELISVVGPHCVVKAAEEGSSIGVYIVEGKQQIAEAINKAFELDRMVVVEQYVAGRELTVVVLGDSGAPDTLRALPIIEIISSNDTYDFDAKYSPGGSKHVCPAEIDGELTKKIQEQAVNAHRVLGCAGVSRTDFLLEANGDFWALETNTLPGMTATSLVPDAAAADGMKFSELCEYLIDNALAR